MKESNRIVLEIWMCKTDKPLDRPDLHNQTLLYIAHVETDHDSVRRNSFTRLNYSWTIIMVYWTKHKQVFLQLPVGMFLLASIFCLLGMEMDVIDFGKWEFPMCFLPYPSKVCGGIIRRSKENKVYVIQEHHLVEPNLRDFSYSTS